MRLRFPNPQPRRSRRPRRQRSTRPRPDRYYAVAGLNLRTEMERLCRLDALGGPGGELARRPPELAVRRASRRPRSRLGFAVPDEHRISVTAFPGIRRGDIEETLLHELVHIAVGAGAGRRRWHGPEFKSTLRLAMAEAYGIEGLNPPSSLHGAYADALEERHEREREAARRRPHPEQLELLTP